jgi:hypothetical protein
MSRKLLISDPWDGQQFDAVLLMYSVGFHFERAAALIKSRFPAATLTAAVPPSMTSRARACQHIDRVLEVERERYSPLRDAGAIVRLVKLLRRDEYGIAVAMFRSIKLGLLLYCTRTRATAVADAAGTLYPWRVGVVSGTVAVVKTVIRRVVGTVAYAVIRLIARLWRLISS